VPVAEPRELAIRRVRARNCNAEAQRAQRSRRVGEVIDDAFDAVLHDFDMKVEEQPNGEVGELDVVQGRRCVDRMKALRGLDLHNDRTIDEQIHPEPAILCVPISYASLSQRVPAAAYEATGRERAR
jgi:hypothetical protein